MHLVYGAQLLVFDDKVVFPIAAAPAVARISPFLDLDQHHFERQPRMGKNFGKINEFIEHIEQHALFWAATALDDPTAFATALRAACRRRLA